MYCSACGSFNDERDQYCRSCGAALSGPVGSPGGYAPPQAVEGTVSAAWRDITTTQGWLKKVLLLCVLGCVPVLNFGIEGFALRWSRDLMMGAREVMPKQVFRKKEILTGFRAWLARLAYTSGYGIVALLATLLVSGFFGLFSYEAAAAMGVLCMVVFGLGYALFLVPLQCAAIMRMTTVDYLEGSLNLGKIFAGYKRSIGGIMASSLLPIIIVGFIQFILYMLFMVIIMAVGAGSPDMMEGFIYGYGYGYALNGLFSAGAGVLFLVALLGIIMSMLSVFSMLFCWRAVGHWAARFVPEWAAESDEEAFAAYAGSRDPSMPTGVQ